MSKPVSDRDVPHATTLLVRDHCLCLHTQRAARALARRFDAAMRPIGLKSGQFSLLISLNRPESPTLGSIARLLAMDRTTLTANLKPLERRGLLTVAGDETDKRARRLRLTEAGRRLLADAVPIWDQVHVDVEAGLSSMSADALRRGLGELV